MAKNNTNKNVKKNIKNMDSTSLRSELKKVNWASPEELAKSTLAVIVLVIFVALIIFISDTIFSLGIKKYTDFVSKRQNPTINTKQKEEKKEQPKEEKKEEKRNDIEILKKMQKEKAEKEKASKKTEKKQ